MIWNYITEKMPERGVPVIVAYINSEGEAEVDEARYSRCRDGWLSTSENKQINVYAWMPWPEAPPVPIGHTEVSGQVDQIVKLSAMIFSLEGQVNDLRQMMKSHLRDHELSDYAYGER